MNTLKDRIKYEIIWGKIEVVIIKSKKKRDTRIRWFSHVQLRPIDTTIRKIDCLKVIGTSRRKERPKKISIEIIHIILRFMQPTTDIRLIIDDEDNDDTTKLTSIYHDKLTTNHFSGFRPRYHLISIAPKCEPCGIPIITLVPYIVH